MNNGTLRPVEGSYLPHLGNLSLTDRELRSYPQRPCPVCCRYFGRDRDMIVVRRYGSRFWVCKSNLEVGDQECGFAFRMGMRRDYVDQLVDKRAQHLPGRAGQVARSQLQGR